MSSRKRIITDDSDFTLPPEHNEEKKHPNNNANVLGKVDKEKEREGEELGKKIKMSSSSSLPLPSSFPSSPSPPPSFLIGPSGSSYLRRLLTSHPSPHSAISTFQSTHSLSSSLPSLSYTNSLDFFSSLGYPRHEVNEYVVKSLIGTLGERIDSYRKVYQKYKEHHVVDHHHDLNAIHPSHSLLPPLTSLLDITLSYLTHTLLRVIPIKIFSAIMEIRGKIPKKYWKIIEIKKEEIPSSLSSIPSFLLLPHIHNALNIIENLSLPVREFLFFSSPHTCEIYFCWKFQLWKNGIEGDGETLWEKSDTIGDDIDHHHIIIQYKESSSSSSILDHFVSLLTQSPQIYKAFRLWASSSRFPTSPPSSSSSSSSPTSFHHSPLPNYFIYSIFSLLSTRRSNEFLRSQISIPSSPEENILLLLKERNGELSKSEEVNDAQIFFSEKLCEEIVNEMANSSAANLSLIPHLLSLPSFRIPLLLSFPPLLTSIVENEKMPSQSSHLQHLVTLFGNIIHFDHFMSSFSSSFFSPPSSPPFPPSYSSFLISQFFPLLCEYQLGILIEEQSTHDDELWKRLEDITQKIFNGEGEEKGEGKVKDTEGGNEKMKMDVDSQNDNDNVTNDSSFPISSVISLSILRVFLFSLLSHSPLNLDLIRLEHFWKLSVVVPKSKETKNSHLSLYDNEWKEVLMKKLKSSLVITSSSSSPSPSPPLPNDRRLWIWKNLISSYANSYGGKSSLTLLTDDEITKIYINQQNEQEWNTLLTTLSRRDSNVNEEENVIMQMEKEN